MVIKLMSLRSPFTPMFYYALDSLKWSVRFSDKLMHVLSSVHFIFYLYNLNCFNVFAEILWDPFCPSSWEKDPAVRRKHSTERQVDGARVHERAEIPAQSVKLKLYRAATKGPRSELVELFMNKLSCEISSCLFFSLQY